MRRAALVCCAIVATIAGPRAQPRSTALRSIIDGDEAWRTRTYPQSGTLQGNSEPTARWRDYSPAALDAERTHARDVLRQLDTIDVSRLSEQEALNHELVHHSTFL